MLVWTTGVFVIISISNCAAWWEDYDDDSNETRTRLEHNIIFTRTVTAYIQEDMLQIYTLVALQKHLEEKLDLCLTLNELDSTIVTPIDTITTTTPNSASKERSEITGATADNDDDESSIDSEKITDNTARKVTIERRTKRSSRARTKGEYKATNPYAIRTIPIKPREL